jgi:hypothetical protein
LSKDLFEEEEIPKNLYVPKGTTFYNRALPVPYF